MNFLNLTEILSKDHPVTVIRTGKNEEIQDVALLENGQNTFRKNTLYFGYYEQLSDSPVWPLQCILCTGTSGREPDTKNPFSAMGAESCRKDISKGVLSEARVCASDLFSVFNQSKTLIEATRSSGFYEELTSLAEKTRSLESVLNEAAIRLGNSLIFCDTAFKIIASSTAVPVKDPIWQENIRQGYCSYEFIRAVKSLDSVRHAGQTTHAFEVTCTESPYRKISSKVFHNGIQIGFLLMIEDENHFLPSHLEMVSTVSHALTFTITHYLPDLVQGITPCQQVLYEMLIGTPVKELLPQLEKLVFPKCMSVLCLRPTQYLGSRHLKEQTTPHLKAILPGTHVTYHKNGIIAVIPLPQCTTVPEELVKSLLPFSAQEHVRIGISNAFSDIEQFLFHSEQASQALALGHRLCPDQSVLRYADYQIYDLLSTVKEPETLGRFCHPALAVLRQYDRNNNTQLYQTLGTYLECGGSIKLTSARMFIHRNSLVYRLNRIAEVCSIHPEDPDTCLLLRVSYCIDHYNGLGDE